MTWPFHLPPLLLRVFWRRQIRPQYNGPLMRVGRRFKSRIKDEININFISNYFSCQILKKSHFLEMDRQVRSVLRGEAAARTFCGIAAAFKESGVIAWNMCYTPCRFILSLKPFKADLDLCPFNLEGSEPFLVLPEFCIYRWCSFFELGFGAELVYFFRKQKGTCQEAILNGHNGNFRAKEKSKRGLCYNFFWKFTFLHGDFAL